MAEMSDFMGSQPATSVAVSKDYKNPHLSTVDNALANALLDWKELELDFFMFLISTQNAALAIPNSTRVSLRDFAKLKNRRYAILLKDLDKEEDSEPNESNDERGSNSLAFIDTMVSKKIIKINDRFASKEANCEFNGSDIKVITKKIPVSTISLRNVFQMLDFNLETGIVEAVFTDWFKPYISELKRNFTSIPVKNFVELKGVQSKRLLMLMMSIPVPKNQSAWVRRRKFTIDEYKEYLNINPSSYLLKSEDGDAHDLKSFKARAVKTNLSRINDCDKYLMSVKYNGRGKDMKDFTITMIPNIKKTKV
jgi:hypothetical protein